MTTTVHKFFYRTNSLSLIIVLVIYAIIAALSLDHVYFWDNIQLTSKEAHWFYNNNFSTLLLPPFSRGAEIVGTGAHPSLMGIMTALLWKLFGMHLWVSHLFVGLWAVLLAWQAFRLVQILFPREIAAFVLPVLLLDSTLLAQISIASPDVVLLTALVASLRYILEKKTGRLTVSLLFLVLISGRGMFTGGFVFLFYLFYRVVVKAEKPSLKTTAQALLPFVPAFTLMAAYLSYYLINRGWFFSNADSPWFEGWKAPENFAGVVKNIFAYFLRLAENGRIFIYITGLFVLFKLWKGKILKSSLTNTGGALLLLSALLFGIFFYFAVTTRVIISSRYYMGLFLAFTLFTFRGLTSLFKPRVVKKVAGLSLIFLITGHLWMYPDKISKAWDATLAHWHWYELRDNCFKYLEEEHYDFSKVSGGFCLAANQRYVDLKDRDLYVYNDTDNKYFIYSNISNLEDEFLEALRYSGKWREIKTFEKGFVEIVIYEKAD